MNPIIAVDFDGTIHEYKTKWTNPTDIPDGPITGAKEFMKELMNAGYKVYIFSSRCAYTGGYEAVIKWLTENEIPFDQVVKSKPPATVILDDRAITFKGKFNKELFKQIKEFKPYYANNKNN